MSLFNNKSVKVNLSILNNSLEALEYSIEDLLNGIHPVNLIDQKIINVSFVLELEKLLCIDTLYELARAIINLENKLSRLEKLVHVDLVLPDLHAFYSSLSPVFLQSFIETNGIEDLDELQENWLEVVRIAIEEELTMWQDKNIAAEH